jgi:predicted transcriptional regulator
MSLSRDESNETGRRERALDDEILRLLFSSSYPWTVEELARELGTSDAEDGVSRLAGAGLVHRIERFAFPTRPAHRARELHEPY